MLLALLRQHRHANSYQGARHDSIDQGTSLQTDAVLAEFHAALLFSSVCSSISDALLRGDHVKLPSAMIPYFPPAPALYAHATTSADTDQGTLKIALLLQDFYQRTEFAKRISTATLSGSAGAARLRELEILANSWHRGFAAGAIASHRIHELSVLSAEAIAKLQATRRLCQAISSGAPKSVLSDGTVIVPQWAECRSEPRLRADIPVVLIINDERHQAVLRDVSLGGAGLQNVPEFPVGTIVKIELADRSSLGGHIVWARSGRLGIEFDRPLSQKHWLMIDLSGTGKRSS